MGAMSVEAPSLLVPADDLSEFACGVDVVDSWARKWAHRAMETNTARVYVSRCGPQVAGLYTLSTHSVERRQGVAGSLRRNAPDPIPCTLLGILGVDGRFQGMGLGWSLLRDAILRARQASAVVASRALVVDPANEAAAGFYRHFGFSPLDDEGRLFLRL